jgi:uncharacterized protein YndB with AHSA1/START domain
MADGAVVVRRSIATSPSRLFRAWTDPDKLARWMSPVGHAEVDVDLRVGGVLRVTMIGEGRRIEHVGEFLELQPPHRLAFTWLSPYTGGVATRVTVDLVGTDDGTDLTIRHELLPTDAVESHAGGWGALLDRLAALAAATTEEEEEEERHVAR